MLLTNDRALNIKAKAMDLMTWTVDTGSPEILATYVMHHFQRVSEEDSDMESL